jgi:hypothetical protein
MRKSPGFLALAAFLFVHEPIRAQSANPTTSNYDPHDAFAPIFYPA